MSADRAPLRRVVSLSGHLHRGSRRGRLDRLGPQAPRDVRDALEGLAAERSPEGDLALADPVLGQRVELETHPEPGLLRVPTLGYDVGVEALDGEPTGLAVLDGRDGETVQGNLLVAAGLAQPEAQAHVTALGIAIGDLVVAGEELEDLDRVDGTCCHWITSGPE